MNLSTRIASQEIPLIECGKLWSIVNAGQDTHWQPVLPLGVTASDFETEIRARYAPKVSIDEDGIATFEIKGAMAHSPSLGDVYFDGVQDSKDHYALLSGLIQNKSVKGVLIKINSPGGMVTGGFEVASQVTALASRVPVVAAIDGIGASLGYLIASQATAVIATSASVVGSVGVIASYADYSRMLESMGVKVELMTNKEAVFKGAGHPAKPLTKDQKDNIQERMDGIFADFKSSVLSKRPNVSDSSLRGQVFYGKEAKKLGLIDAVGDQNYALSVLKRMVGKKPTS